ncbi:MAG: HAD family hydrolase [Bacteroidales bacterium]|nr:HAD family hydrolase [Bacteroidales bacterium]
MNFRAVIFDLDGTLADTLEDIADAMNRVLSSLGYPAHKYDEYRFLVGNGIKNLVKKSLPESAQTEENIETCFRYMMDDYENNYLNKTSLYTGIPDLLDKLSSDHVKLAVLSNKADSITQKICDVLLKNWPFTLIMGANNRFPRKPDPQSALYIAEYMELKPRDICYLGDSDVDMQTANAAGFFSIGAGWGFRPKKELIDSGAKKVIDFPTEMLSLF